MKRRATILMVAGLIVLAGWSRSVAETAETAAEEEAQIVLFNITSSATESVSAMLVRRLERRRPISADVSKISPPV